MTLASKLDAIREGAAKRRPAEQLQAMARATRALRESGIMDHVVRAGDRLPEFALANRSGIPVRSADLLARGPLVLSVFRGSW